MKSELLRNRIEFHLSKLVCNESAFKISDIGRQRDIGLHDIPLSGFERYWVSPSDIERMTGRSWKPWDNRKKLFGAIKTGDWDQRAPPIPESDPLYPHYSSKFDEWTRYIALQEHLDGKSWSDTQYYKLRIEEGWTHQNLENEIQHLKNLYESIQENGYLTQKELGKYPQDKRNRLGNEITVDISRDGEFLHVDGHHRLEVAKSLNLETIPVVVLVRHDKWVNKLEELTVSGKILDLPLTHPDVKKCRNQCHFGSATSEPSSMPRERSW